MDKITPTKIREYRKYVLIMSQDEAAEKYGVTTASWWGWEAGRRYPTAAQGRQLLRDIREWKDAQQG